LILEHGGHPLAWPGTRVRTGEMIPGPGTWEILEHRGCAGEGTLRPLSKNRRAPRCGTCGQEVVWQLTHLASSVAADHRGVGQLP
jgi:hypothetical protein